MVGYKRNRSYKRKVTKETESITWPRVVLVRTTAIAQVLSMSEEKRILTYLILFRFNNMKKCQQDDGR